MLNWSASPKNRKKKKVEGREKKENQTNGLDKQSLEFVLIVNMCINSLIVDAGTFLTLGKQRGDLKALWTMGEPERPCRHIQFQPSGS